MVDLIITMADERKYRKSFPTSGLCKLFLAKLELFEGLFIDISEGDEVLQINPKYIIRVEEVKVGSINR
jgi:hypothetical protein